MLKRSLRTIDKASEEIFDHPIRNAKILAGTALACLAFEKIHHRYDAWRERSVEQVVDEESAGLPILEEVSHE